ncbi:MAG: SDR family oxidoreductase, partial [SAR202 cluster bacterium]|nr:SDR family oxidoreductase [SAR202 cluster bacterium]
FLILSSVRKSEFSLTRTGSVFSRRSNLTGAFLGIRTCASLLKQNRGCVVNVSSIVGLQGNDRMVAYAASKAGLLGLTYATAKDFSRHGVRVNAVCPGTVETQMTESFFGTGSDEQEIRRSSVAKHPLGRLGSAADVASAVTYLASAGANFITGVALPVDGGRSLG